MIWVPKHKPRSEPKFHHVLIFDDEGKSINALLTILIMDVEFGWVYSLLYVVIQVLVLIICFQILSTCVHPLREEATFHRFAVYELIPISFYMFCMLYLNIQYSCILNYAVLP